MRRGCEIPARRDARRFGGVLTDGGCHLSATLVRSGLDKVPLENLDLLIIENVGNPICPANFDLGEHARMSVLSIAEGDDKPAKYPLLFKDADLIVLAKYDLPSHVDFDVERATYDLRRMNKEAEILLTDIKTATGIDRLAEWMLDRAQQSRLSRPLSAPAR